MARKISRGHVFCRYDEARIVRKMGMVVGDQRAWPVMKFRSITHESGVSLEVL
ncbi:MAG: hypothetical protein JXB48_01725 [Candidatus Latescibacteria bacterium]|nr:hypothetical protein [Candidatus Latescibacterota bacterium]